jgi:hypothetical protein
MQDAQAYWDAEADAYARRNGEHGFSCVKQRVLAALPQSCGTVLEMGCGAGGMLPELADRAIHYVGMDLSVEMKAAGPPEILRCGYRAGPALPAQLLRLCGRDRAF